MKNLSFLWVIIALLIFPFSTRASFETSEVHSNAQRLQGNFPSLELASASEPQLNSSVFSEDKSFTANLSQKIRFYQIRPFQKAGILFFITFGLMLISLYVSDASYVDPSREETIVASSASGVGFYRTAIVFSLFGTALTLYGLIVWSRFLGHFPFDAGSDRLVWAGIATMILGLIFEALYRSRYFILIGSLGASLGLIFSDFHLGPDFKTSLSSLSFPFIEIFTGLMILLGAAAFWLSSGIANVAIGYAAFKPLAFERIRRLYFFSYRLLPVGIVSLASGIAIGVISGYAPGIGLSSLMLCIYFLIFILHQRTRFTPFVLAAAISISFCLILKTVSEVIFANSIPSVFGKSYLGWLILYGIFQLLWIALTALLRTRTQISRS